MMEFSSSKGYITIGDQKYCVRILEMIKSTLIILCHAETEYMDEMAVAMPVSSSGQIIGTNILAKELTTNSQGMAERLSKRFKRQIFVSHNVNMDRIIAPQLESKLNQYIRKQLQFAEVDHV